MVKNFVINLTNKFNKFKNFYKIDKSTCNINQEINNEIKKSQYPNIFKKSVKAKAKCKIRAANSIAEIISNPTNKYR